MSRIIKGSVWEEDPCVVEVPLPPPSPKKSGDEGIYGEKRDAAQRHDLEDSLARQQRELEEARAAFDETRETMMADLYQKKEGIAQIREEQKQIILDANAKAEKTMTDAKEESHAYVLQAENEIASLAMDIVDKVLPQHFIDVPQIILPLIRKALLKVKDQQEVVIRVSPGDYDLILLARSELQNILEGSSAVLEIHSDETLGAGDSILETPNGNVDARVATQLEIIRKAVQDAMS